MKPQTQVEDLLRWRAAQAEAEAPPAPRAARLLELARPWWETWPEKFRATADRVNAMPFAYGHAMTASPALRSGYPVPAIIIREGGDETETSVRVLLVSVREGRFRLRFQLESAADGNAPTFESTFLAEGQAGVLLDARALRSVDSEYRVDADLPPQLAPLWKDLKVTDRMPFRLILRVIKGTEAASLD